MSKVSAKPPTQTNEQLKALVMQARQDSQAVLNWLQNSKQGRKYLGERLMQIHGLRPKERTAFQRASGFKHMLVDQFNILADLGFSVGPHEDQTGLMGALLSAINHTGADDEQCPQRLRDWLRAKKKSCEETWGITISRHYWPNSSKEEMGCRAVFQFAMAELGLRKELADQLITPDTPRLLARALVNHLAGPAKIKYFQKSPITTRDFVTRLCADERLSQACEHLRILLTTKITQQERKDIPAKRLKAALTEQFQIWRDTRYPTPERFAKVAVLATPPWVMAKMTAKRGDKKMLALRLLRHQSAITGHKPSVSSAERSLRTNAFRN